MKRAIILLLAAGILAAANFAAASPMPARTPQAQDAANRIFAAFQQHPVVLVGDAHHLAQEGAFYEAIVRDRRFAEQVGNVVVEFGGAAHQDTMDRYVNGDPVTYADLRRVWTDVVGWDVPPSQMYAKLFATVRVVNMKIPPAKRIHVWLGEPPIDWRKLHDFSDLDPYMTQRDSYPTRLINDQILAHHRKALVIYGTTHFVVSAALNGPFGPNIRDGVERNHPGSTFLIYPYWGYEDRACVSQFEAQASTWKAPSIVSPIGGTWLAGLMRRCGGSGGLQSPDPVQEKAIQADWALSGAAADALLYLGRAATLLHDADDPSLYLDPEYVAEWNRSRACCFPSEMMSMDPDKILRENSEIPRKYTGP